MEYVVLIMFLMACAPVSHDFIQGGQGAPGTNGTKGNDGLSVVISTAPTTPLECSNGGTVVALAVSPAGTPYNTSEPDQTIFFVCNGQDAKNPLEIVYPIAPCTNASSPYKEQLLCLNDGGILGSFSDTMSGSNTRFAFLPSGSYIDTDDSGCNFSVVTASGASTLSYSAGSNQYASWAANSITCQVQQ